MKKHLLLLTALAATYMLQAQWGDNPAANTLIANSSDFGGEIYLATDKSTSDTYVQWSQGSSNGWAPNLQCLNFEGVPQWGSDGIHISGHNFYSSSEGFSMVTTTDKAVVSCFATADDQTVAVKINSDGTFLWGEQGIILFDSLGFSRTELVAGDDGGVWALGFDYQQHYMQYIEANGTLNPTITISSPGYNVCYGQMTLGLGNSVFLTYEKTGSGFYTDKEIYVIGYTKDGNQIGPAVQLMASQTFQVTYLHHVVPDGLGGGYAYIWHSGIGGVFNTYVFHYDANGFSTISNPDGIAVHSSDPTYNYLDAYATVDPVSHDLLIAYIKENSAYQSNGQIYVNRITPSGERVWGEGILAVDFEGLEFGSIKIDAFEDGSGFSLVYEKEGPNNPYSSTVEAKGFDMEVNELWSKTISSNVYNRSMCENSTGFLFGQNVVAWINSTNGGLYGQNIGYDGSMGEITPPEPPAPCYAPENFGGEYVFNMEEQLFGVNLTWAAPETEPLHFNLYRTNLDTEETIVIEVDATETEYFDETGTGSFLYRLTAVYENGESAHALTSDDADFIIIEVTGLPENTDTTIVTILSIYNANGQVVANKSLEELHSGIYILQGLTKDRQITSKKVVINK